ncbi:hypothetical protein VTN00DRAFT_7564 [Thermoascus crustaceus]|uniref:uncharacterized protein n=1 Tax=Thermoascus crustaceus TaxID=5088 RepID=UPI00374330E8
MITDDDLYQLAIFLGSCAMLLVVLYHYLEVNAADKIAEAGAGAEGSVSNKGQGQAGSGTRGVEKESGNGEGVSYMSGALTGS